MAFLIMRRKKTCFVYPCGMALRFARVTRIRADKSPGEADTLGRVREIYARQVKKHR